MKLVYVNELGPNYKGDNIYEFIFSDLDDVWGEEWDAEPASGKPLPPNIEYIKKVGILRTSDIELVLVQNSDYFSVYDATDGVVSLSWEDANSVAIVDMKYKRLVFQYGESVQSVEDKKKIRTIHANSDRAAAQ